MGGPAERIKERFLSTAEAKTPIEIPEWQMTVFIGPWSWGQMLEVQNTAASESMDFLRDVIRVKAKTEKGAPAFDKEDIDAMKSHGEADVINRVATEILEAYPLDFKKK